MSQVSKWRNCSTYGDLYWSFKPNFRISDIILRKYQLTTKTTTNSLQYRIMEHILDETVPNDDLKKFEQKYHEELQNGKVLEKIA